MVRNGQTPIVQVSYVPPTPAASGVEVLTLAELGRRMRGHPSADRTQRPDFHLVLSVDRGVVWHMVDFQDQAVGPGEWLWVRPGQVQRFGDLTDLAAASGTVVMFPPGAVPATSASGIALDEPFGGSWWSPGGDDQRVLKEALRHLEREYDVTRTPAGVRAEILQHLLTVLLLRLRMASVSGAGAGAASGEDAAATFGRFRAAVEAGFTAHRDVAHYARLLGYAPRSLTRATLAATGVGAKEFIDGRVVLEAKRLLAHGDDPVASVGAGLGFLDTSNFVKYFAARAGQTPAAFRRGFRAGAAKG